MSHMSAQRDRERERVIDRSIYYPCELPIIGFPLILRICS